MYGIKITHPEAILAKATEFVRLFNVVDPSRVMVGFKTDMWSPTFSAQCEFINSKVVISLSFKKLFEESELGCSEQWIKETIAHELLHGKEFIDGAMFSDHNTKFWIDYFKLIKLHTNDAYWKTLYKLYKTYYNAEAKTLPGKAFLKRAINAQDSRTKFNL